MQRKCLENSKGFCKLGTMSNKIVLVLKQYFSETSHSFCKMFFFSVTRYCKVIYPSQDVRNVVEGNKQVLVDGSLVTPYRCLGKSVRIMQIVL